MLSNNSSSVTSLSSLNSPSPPQSTPSSSSNPPSSQQQPHHHPHSQHNQPSRGHLHHHSHSPSQTSPVSNVVSRHVTSNEMHFMMDSILSQSQSSLNHRLDTIQRQNDQQRQLLTELISLMIKHGIQTPGVNDLGIHLGTGEHESSRGDEQLHTSDYYHIHNQRNGTDNSDIRNGNNSSRSSGGVVDGSMFFVTQKDSFEEQPVVDVNFDKKPDIQTADEVANGNVRDMMHLESVISALMRENEALRMENETLKLRK